MGRLNGIIAVLAMVLLAGGLTGCGAFGGEEEEAAAAPVEVIDPARLVESVVDIELGRLADGYALSVFGLSATAGWSAPELRLRDTEPDAAGVLDFDFVAVPPAEASTSPMAMLPEARRVRADRLLSEAFLSGLSGLRIWTAAGPTEVAFN
jgi:hypothetical protein